MEIELSSLQFTSRAHSKRPRLSDSQSSSSDLQYHPADNQPFSLLPVEILCRVLARLTFRELLVCETVCSSWRTTLRSSSASCSATAPRGLWGAVRIRLTPASHEYIVKFDSRLPLLPDEARTSIRIAETHILSSKDGFKAWLRSHAAGTKSICLVHEADELGWRFPQLVTAISSSILYSNADTTFTLKSGLCL